MGCGLSARYSHVCHAPLVVLCGDRFSGESGSPACRLPLSHVVQVTDDGRVKTPATLSLPGQRGWSRGELCNVCVWSPAPVLPGPLMRAAHECVRALYIIVGAKCVRTTAVRGVLACSERVGSVPWHAVWVVASGPGSGAGLSTRRWRRLSIPASEAVENTELCQCTVVKTANCSRSDPGVALVPRA